MMLDSRGVYFEGQGKYDPTCTYTEKPAITTLGELETYDGISNTGTSYF